MAANGYDILAIYYMAGFDDVDPRWDLRVMFRGKNDGTQVGCDKTFRDAALSLLKVL
jgi:hypothetical protein